MPSWTAPWHRWIAPITAAPGWRSTRLSRRSTARASPSCVRRKRRISRSGLRAWTPRAWRRRRRPYAQRVKMIRHLGSALSGATYVFDKPPRACTPQTLTASTACTSPAPRVWWTCSTGSWITERPSSSSSTTSRWFRAPIMSSTSARGQAPRVGRWWPRTRAPKRGVTFPTQAICSSVTGLCNVSTRASDSVKRAGADTKKENMALWRSWLARRPVTAEVAGSSPVRVAELLGKRVVLAR